MKVIQPVLLVYSSVIGIHVTLGHNVQASRIIDIESCEFIRFIVNFFLNFFTIYLPNTHGSTHGPLNIAGWSQEFYREILVANPHFGFYIPAPTRIFKSLTSQCIIGM